MTTISQERVKWDAVPGHPAMRRREHWGARRAYTDARTVNEPATRVFVHISITNPSAYNSYDAHARAIEAIGISRFPSTGISYNRMFMAGSTVVREGQPIGRRGAHTVNDFKRSTCSTSGCPGRGSSLTAPSWNLNYNARAYVWCANVNNTVPDSVVELIARAIYTDYKAGFITKAAAQNIHGHRCVSAKSCPGDRMWARMKEIQSRVNQLIAQGPTEKGDDDMPYRDWPKADKDALLSDIFDAVWKTDTDTKGIPAPDGYNADGSNPFWAASSMLRSIQFYARRAAELAGAPTDVAALATALAPLLPSGNAPTQEQLEAALKSVLGSLDDAPG